MNFSKLLDLRYLFDTHPDPDMSSFLTLLIIFACLFLMALGFSILFRFKKFTPLLTGYLRRIPGKLYAVSITGVILLIFRYEGSPYLSMRFLLLFVILIFVIWVVYFLIQMIYTYPKQKAKVVEKKKMERYRPGQ